MLLPNQDPISASQESTSDDEGRFGEDGRSSFRHSSKRPKVMSQQGAAFGYGNGAEMPLLTNDVLCNYPELLGMVQNMDCKINGVDQLPGDLILRILSCLTIQRVVPHQVRVLGCSSHDKIHPLACCLSPTEDTWWLSAPRTMPEGRGKQWLQFRLAPHLCRLSAVRIKIPPLPQGPLSVREFEVHAFDIYRGWHAIAPAFTVENRAGWQRFELPPLLDVDEIRLVCLSNQISPFADPQSNAAAMTANGAALLRRLESVGFFSVRFE